MERNYLLKHEEQIIGTLGLKGRVKKRARLQFYRESMCDGGEAITQLVLLIAKILYAFPILFAVVHVFMWNLDAEVIYLCIIFPYLVEIIWKVIHLALLIGERISALGHALFVLETGWRSWKVISFPLRWLPVIVLGIGGLIPLAVQFFILGLISEAVAWLRRDLVRNAIIECE